MEIQGFFLVKHFYCYQLIAFSMFFKYWTSLIKLYLSVLYIYQI